MSAKGPRENYPDLPGFEFDDVEESGELPTFRRPPIVGSQPFPDEYQTGLDNLNALIAEIKPGKRNEATTRLHIIDRILFECFGWDKNNCISEEAHGQEYTDYVMLCPWRTIIIEAKKESASFELPITRKPALVRSLPAILNSNKNLAAAAQQVAKYCQTRGIQNAAITNGNQLIAFIGSRTDGAPPLEGKAVVFESLEHLQKNFLFAWNCLSQQAIIEEKLSALLGQADPLAPPKTSSGITPYPGFIERNNLQADLEIVADLVFTDISESRALEIQFLNECYCKNGALSQHSSLTKSILEARYAQLFIDDQSKPSMKPATDRKGGIDQDLIAEGLAKRPIVIVGDVGAGKTSFLRKMLLIDAPEILRESITIYIDLGRSATLNCSVREHVLADIPRQLRSEHDVDIEERNVVRGIYDLELDRFSKGIFQDLRTDNPELFKLKELEFLEKKLADTGEHIKAALKHLSKGRKKTITLILDNCDQREEPDQQAAFLISEEIASSWDCVVFVTLRPETFNRSRRKGALTGYHPKVFSIYPPRVDQMLDKRLAFAEKICTGQIPLEKISSHTRFEKLNVFIDVVRYSLKNSRTIMGMVDDIAAGNMRVALDLLKEFISSGHVDTDKILDKYTREGKYLISPHEFLRAIIYQDHIYYDPQSSHVVNIFQQWSTDQKEIFIVPILISAAVSLGEKSAAMDGFVSYSELVLLLQRYGFTPRQISRACKFALESKLVEVAGRLIPEVQYDSLPGIRVTSHGKFHIGPLASTFAYIYAILVDTRLGDQDLNGKISKARALAARIKVSAEFISMIDVIWEKAEFADCVFDWPSAKKAVLSDLQKVTRYA